MCWGWCCCRCCCCCAVAVVPANRPTLSVVCVVLQDPMHHEHLGRLLADHAQADGVALVVCTLHRAHRHQACRQQHTCEQATHITSKGPTDTVDTAAAAHGCWLAPSTPAADDGLQEAGSLGLAGWLAIALLIHRLPMGAPPVPLSSQPPVSLSLYSFTRCRSATGLCCGGAAACCCCCCMLTPASFVHNTIMPVQ